MKTIVRTIKGYSKYTISNQGRVYDKDNGKEVRYIYGTDVRARLIPDNGEASRSISLVWLVATTFLEVPKHLKGMTNHQLRIRHLDGDTDNLHPNNLCYFHPSELEDTSIKTKYKTKLLKYLKARGLKLIRGYERYAINNDGTEVINISKMTQCNISDLYARYQSVHVSREVNGKKHVNLRRIHWLVLQTWGKLPTEAIGDKHLDIHHLDGDPSNNHIKNLSFTKKTNNKK